MFQAPLSRTASDLSNETGPERLIHATVVAIGGRGVLIRGPSGSGKSDLALRLLDRGAELVADDYALVWEEDGKLLARAPGTIFGKIEVRGVGVVDWPARGRAELALRIELSGPRDDLSWLSLPSVAIEAFAASAPLLVEHALARLGPIAKSG